MKVLQINLHHSKAASAALCQHFLREGYDLALIQEPWLHRGRIAGLGDSKGKLISSCTSGKMRTCILVRQDLQCLPLLQWCSRDITSLNITWSQDGGERNTITVCSVYLPHDSTAPPPTVELESIVEHATAERHQLLLGCDANAHHQIGWGSTDTNVRGEALLDFIVAHNLHVLNVGSRPTFVTRGRQEVIDVTLCTENVVKFIRGWHVVEEPSLSDHKFICFHMQMAQDAPLVRNPRRTNWLSYKGDLEAPLEGLRRKVKTVEDLDCIANAVQDAILTSYHDNCPVRQRGGRSNTKWWTSYLERKRAHVRRLYNHCKVSGKWGIYHKALTEYTTAIKTAKQDSWQRFTMELKSLKEAARLQKVLASNPANPMGTLKFPGGNYTGNARESLELLLETHFPDCDFGDSEDGAPNGNGECSRPRATPESWANARRIITLSNVKWALTLFSPFKSPGGDGIFPALLQEGPDSLQPILCELFRASLAYGYIPRAWRLSRVVFIPKRGRSDHSSPKSYRPISLSSFLLKTLERLVERYVRRRVLSDTPLHRNQHAYQPGKSCETALHQLVGRIEDSLAGKEIALCAFLDIEGAFSNVPLEAMTRAVLRRGVNPSISKWIGSMLRCRRVKATLQGESVEVTPTRGCPQGGVLSPLLWNLVVDGLLVELTDAGIYIQGYADDIVLMVQGKYCNVVADMMNVGLRLVNRWCEREGLSVNPLKTVIVPFTRKRNLESLSRLKLGNTQLGISTEVKYLGITLDHKLSWNSHLDNVLHKAKWALMMSRRFASMNWGIKPHIALLLYEAVVRPQITYGILVWWPKIRQSTVCTKLTSTQRLGCLLVTGAFRSSPTITLEVALGLLPLDLHLMAEARKAAYRLSAASHWRNGLTSSGHSSIVKVIPGESVLDMTSDVMGAEFSFCKSFSVSVKSRQDWDGKPSPRSDDRQLVCYTDGSLINGNSGYGVYCPSPQIAISASLGKYCTVFQAEIMAITACANLGISRHYHNKRLTILSDSQAALKALDSHKFTSKLVWDCFQALSILGERNNVQLGWVPGHSGVQGNERADELAREGAAKPFTGPEPVCGISRATAYAAVKRWSRGEHQLRWQEYPGQKMARQMLRAPSVQLTRFLLQLNRVKLRQVLALITGHGHFRKHLHKIGILPNDPMCRLCHMSEETAEHILLECRSLRSRRRAIFGFLQPGEDMDNCLGRQLLDLVEGTGIGLPL